MIHITDNGQGPFIKINDKIIFITEEQIKKINYGYTVEENNGILTFLENDLTKQKDLNIKIDTIQGEFEQSIKIIKNGYSQAEIDSWEIQLQEAKIVLDGGSSDFITGMLKTGETELELASKIITNSNIYKTEFAKALQIKREKLNNL